MFQNLNGFYHAKKCFLYYLVFAHAIALETKFIYTGIESPHNHLIYLVTQTTFNVQYLRLLSQGH